MSEGTVRSYFWKYDRPYRSQRGCAACFAFLMEDAKRIKKFPFVFRRDDTETNDNLPLRDYCEMFLSLKRFNHEKKISISIPYYFGSIDWDNHGYDEYDLILIPEFEIDLTGKLPEWQQ